MEIARIVLSSEMREKSYSCWLMQLAIYLPLQISLGVQKQLRKCDHDASPLYISPQSRIQEITATSVFNFLLCHHFSHYSLINQCRKPIDPTADIISLMIPAILV